MLGATLESFTAQSIPKNRYEVIVVNDGSKDSTPDVCRAFASRIEDIELGYRLSRFGLRVVFHRSAISYMTRAPIFKEFCDRCERQGEALFLFSRLHDDPVVQKYCQLADPFIDNRAVSVDPETRWPEVAALFREKIDQAERIERLL